MSYTEQHLPPGFRFHPTDDELILYYLRNRAASLPCPVPIIAEVDIYKFNPWDLPAKALFGDREWYFFTPRDRKYPNGVRPNRAAASGYWKATGTDKPIVSGGRRVSVGVKKALVFYRGKPPKGSKTSWIMHEYRLAESLTSSSSGSSNYNPGGRPAKPRDSSMRLDDWVLCRIYKKQSHTPSTSGGGQAEAADREDDQKVPSTEETYMLPLPLPNPADQYLLPKSASLSDLIFQDADFSVLLHHNNNPTDAAVLDLASSHWHQYNNFEVGDHSSCSNNMAAVPRLQYPDSTGTNDLLDLKHYSGGGLPAVSGFSSLKPNYFNSGSHSHSYLGFR